jgi:hypothetical protein
MSESCFRLDTDSVLGRLLRSTRSISPGEIVLSEEPIVTWVNPRKGPAGSKNYISAFCDLDATQQASVQDMHCPTSVSKAYRGAAEALHKELSPAISICDIQNLLAIAESNSHEFFGGAPVQGSEPRAALFVIGSKVNHRYAPEREVLSIASECVANHPLPTPIAAAPTSATPPRTVRGGSPTRRSAPSRRATSSRSPTSRTCSRP